MPDTHHIYIFFGRIIFIDTFSYATWDYFIFIHDISYVGVHLLWWHTMLSMLAMWIHTTVLTCLYSCESCLCLSLLCDDGLNFCWTSSGSSWLDLFFYLSLSLLVWIQSEWVSFTLSLIDMWVRFINSLWMLGFLYER